MKNLAYGLLALIMALFIIQGCKKSGLTAVKGQLVATKLTLKLNEPDSLVLVGEAADPVQWSVTPAGTDSLLKLKNKAIVKFSKAGSYTVTASANDGTTASVTVTVTSDVYVSNPVYTVIPFTDEQMTLMPVYYKSKNADTTYMYFVAHTTKLYPCANSKILYTKTPDIVNLSLNFIGEQRPDPGNCLMTPATLTSDKIYYFYGGTRLDFTPGTHPFTVTLSGTTYTGSIVVSTTDITFNWDYTAGVTIFPKHLNL